MRTPRGVLLHWDPPELVPETLDGYVLEGRQGSQGWEVLDRVVAGTDARLLVPGLIKVRGWRAPGRPSPRLSRPQLQPQPSASHADLPTAVFLNRAAVGGAGP